MRKFTFIGFTFLLLSFQLACTSREGFNSNGRGFAGYNEPPPTTTERKIANFTNSKSKCSVHSLSETLHSLKCHVYILDANGVESLANEVASGVAFTWALLSNIDMAPISSCSVSNDSLSYSCEINSSSFNTVVQASVTLSITDNDNEQPKTISESLQITPSVVETPSTPADSFFSSVKLLLKMIGTPGDSLLDSSGRGIINHGVEIVDSPSKFGNGAGLFDGNDFIEVPSHSDFDFGSGDFTLEMYVNFSQIDTYNRLITRWDNPLRNWFLAQEVGVWKFCYSTDGSNSIVLQYQEPAGTKTNEWYHIAISRNGGMVKMFLNGVEVGSIPISGSIASSNQVVHVGKLKTVEGPQFKGRMNYVRVTKGVGRYVTNFAPPSPSSF